MEACIETSALLASNPAPAWAVRVARPVGDRFRMAEDLRGVPKAALQSVFGKLVGQRIWHQARPVPVTAASTPEARPKVADAEITAGLVEYVSQQAADTLRQRCRQAKEITLTATYEDGRSTSTRVSLARPAHNAAEIAAAAKQALRQLPARSTTMKSMALAVTAIGIDSTAPERTNAPIIL